MRLPRDLQLFLASVKGSSKGLHKKGSRWCRQTGSLMVNLEYTQHFAGDFGMKYTSLGHTVKNMGMCF